LPLPVVKSGFSCPGFFCRTFELLTFVLSRPNERLLMDGCATWLEVSPPPFLLPIESVPQAVFPPIHPPLLPPHRRINPRQFYPPVQPSRNLGSCLHHFYSSFSSPVVLDSSRGSCASSPTAGCYFFLDNSVQSTVFSFPLMVFLLGPARCLPVI